MSRPNFAPSSEHRGNVEALIGYGLTEAEICRLIKNPETGKPIDLKTLRKHFRAEIATGFLKLKSLAGQRIVATMLGREGGIKDPRAQTTMLVFFAKTRMGWKETTIHQHAGLPGGDPILVKYAEDDLDRKISRLLAADAAAKVSAEPE